MLQIISIALGSTIGVLLRFWLVNIATYFLGQGFPYGTLIVNVLGPSSLGCAYFSIEALHLLSAEEFYKSTLNILSYVGLCLFASAIAV